MNIPPYFKQQGNSSCSLAILRMVLAAKGINITEEELVNKVEENYGKNFKNIWNPTIAKLAREHGIDVTFYASWPLFKDTNMEQALKEYKNSPETFNINKYENPDDKDVLPEPLNLAYKEMFRAVELGCKYEYGGIDKNIIINTLSNNSLIQLSIHLKKLYPEKYKTGYHSILLYKYEKGKVFYHDPYNGESLSTNIDDLINATMDTEAFMVYKT